MTNAELKKRFPKSNFSYEPTPSCRKCKGTGVAPAKKLPSGTMLNESPCACVFFGPNTELLTKLISQSAKKVLEELKQET